MKKLLRNLKMNLNDFKNLLIDNIPHALVRYGDGEKNIFNNINCQRKGFKFDSAMDKSFRQDLLDSYNAKINSYYVADKEISACLFVNENYPIFINHVIPLFKSYHVIFIGNDKSDLTKLPFPIKTFFPVSNNAWRYFPNIHNDVLEEIKNNDQPVLVLLACGPYSNVLVHKLWKANNKSIYWNIGSTLDPYLYGEKTRQYHERMF
jgi:hypothetical protein